MRLYHFMKQKHALESLINRRLHISLIKDLNDPFELFGVVVSDNSQKEDLATIKAKFSKEFGIICFSGCYSNILMWSHYSDKHMGTCLGFDIDDQLFADKIARKVGYINEKMEFDHFYDDSPEKVKRFEQLLTTKSSDWNYEQEYRVFCNFDQHDRGHYFESFSEKIELKEVILGCMPESKGEQLQLKLDELYRYMGDLKDTVEIYQASMCPNEFKVLKQPIK